MTTLLVVALVAFVVWGLIGMVTNQVTGGVSWGEMPERRPDLVILETQMRPFRCQAPESLEDAS